MASAMARYGPIWHLSSVERWSPGCGDGWWLTYPSEKWWSSSMGRMTSHILWKMKNVPNHQPVYIICKYCIYVCVYIYISETFATSVKMKLQLWSWQECFSNLIHALLVKKQNKKLPRALLVCPLANHTSGICWGSSQWLLDAGVGQLP